MSTVIGFKSGKNVWIASDGRGISQNRITTAKTVKIFRNGDYLIGYTGYLRGGQIFETHYFEAPDDLYAMPQAMREQSSAHGCLIDDEGYLVQVSNFMIAYKNKLYTIMSDFSLIEIPTYNAIGSGADFALGALKVLESFDLTPNEKIKLALESTCSFDNSSAPPFTIEKY